MTQIYQNLDIIIQGGQSNAEGYGTGPAEQEFVPREDILYLLDRRTVDGLPRGIAFSGEKEFYIEPAQEHLELYGLCSDFALTFAERYIQKGHLQPGRKLLIVRTAVGGTSFAAEQWGINNPLHTRLMEMTHYAQNLHHSNKVVGFLWHQGESDAERSCTTQAHKNQLKAMLDEVRGRYGNIPFIAGDFVQEWKNSHISIAEPVIKAIRQVVNESSNAAFVETVGLLSNNQKVGNGDDIHFCRQALQELGLRYYAAFDRLNSAP